MNCSPEKIEVYSRVLPRAVERGSSVTIVSLWAGFFASGIVDKIE